jgi:poly(3-hydroxybutyrate) depolymerase
MTGAPREPAPLTAPEVHALDVQFHGLSDIEVVSVADCDRISDLCESHELLRSQLEQAQRECAEAREGHVATLAEFHAARAEAEKLREAIAWVLGERGAFPGRIYTEGPYWWRTELRRRAALSTPPAGEKP